MSKSKKIAWGIFIAGSLLALTNQAASAQYFGTILTVEYGVDLPGSDYKGHAVEDLGKCVSLCANDPNCKSYTFVKKNQQPPHGDNQSPLCHLKNAKPGKIRHAGMISGYKN